MQETGQYTWNEAYQTQNPHDKAQHFHETLIAILRKHLKTKSVNISSLDKSWFNQAIKLKYDTMQI